MEWPVHGPSVPRQRWSRHLTSPSLSQRGSHLGCATVNNIILHLDLNLDIHLFPLCRIWHDFYILPWEQ